MTVRILEFISPGRPRELSAIESGLIFALAAVTCGLFVTVAFGVYIDGGLLLYWFLGVVLAVSFLTLNGNPARPRRGTPFGWLAATLALAIAVYFIARQPYYERRLPMIDELSLLDQAAGIAAVLLI